MEGSTALRDMIFAIICEELGLIGVIIMFLMFGYDILRLWRWFLPHGKIWVWVEDLLYWSLSGIPVFILFFRMIDGVPRWYGIVGMLAGGILYEAGISIPIRAGLHRILGKYNKKIGFRVAKLAKMLYSKITGPNSKS